MLLISIVGRLSHATERWRLQDVEGHVRELMCGNRHPLMTRAHQSTLTTEGWQAQPRREEKITRELGEEQENRARKGA